MKKNNTVCNYKYIQKNSHAVAPCQIYKECEISTPETNNSKQDARTRLNEVRATSENTSESQLDLLDYINECSTEQQQKLSTDKTNKNNNNTNNVVLIHQTNAALNRCISNNSANHNKNRKPGVPKLVNNNNNDNTLLLIKNSINTNTKKDGMTNQTQHKIHENVKTITHFTLPSVRNIA